MRNTLRMLGLCGAWLAACDGGGGAGDLSFQDMCEQGVVKMCALISTCSSPVPDCVAELKALNCAGGPEQFCGVGSTFESSKAPACLATLDALGCEALREQPAACTPESLCSSSPHTGDASTPSTGQACSVLGDPEACAPEASVCYAAGTASSCPGRGLCAGDASGMTCATHCTADSDCSSAGLVCIQGCEMPILEGFCVQRSLQERLLESTCPHGPASSVTGWSR